jgi:hypothetical protein
LDIKLEGNELKVQLLSDEIMDLKVFWQVVKGFNSVSKKLGPGQELNIDQKNE